MDVKELLKLNKKDEIIVIDSNNFDYYSSHGLENYSIRYHKDLSYLYNFAVKDKTAFYKLLQKYVSIVDPHETLNLGIYNHEKVTNTGIVLGIIARYFIYILFQ